MLAADERLPGFFTIGGGGIPPSAIWAVDGVLAAEERLPGFFTMGGGGMPPSAICVIPGATEAIERPPGFLTIGGGGIPPSVRKTGRELDCAAGVKLVKQSESAHRERAEIVRSCLVVMFSPFMKWNPWNRGIR
jgi:hypothetical protein